MRIASFNVENLFDRARALKLPWDEGAEVLEPFTRLNRLLNEPVYSDEDKQEIVRLLTELGLAKKDDGGKYVELRQIRGRLVKRPKAGGLQIVAEGRASWIGWIELKTEPVDELAMEHTAMVIRDVAADVIGVVEAENRIVLDKFSALLLERVGGEPYAHIMVIDGNDDRGIDVGLMTRVGYDIVTIRSHVDDRDAKGEVFSRDCPEYVVTTPTGGRLVLLVNHFKSKGYGKAKDSARSANAKRRASPRSTSGCSPTARRTSLSSETSTTRPSPTRSNLSSRPASRTSPSIPPLPATAALAPTRTGRRARRSTTCSSHQRSSTS